jgi:hypothetical protein
LLLGVVVLLLLWSCAGVMPILCRAWLGAPLACLCIMSLHGVFCGGILCMRIAAQCQPAAAMVAPVDTIDLTRLPALPPQVCLDLLLLVVLRNRDRIGLLWPAALEHLQVGGGGAALGMGCVPAHTHAGAVALVPSTSSTPLSFFSTLPA